MEKIDKLLTNAFIITMDNDFNQYEPGVVAIKGDKIVAVGSQNELLESFTAGEVIDCKGHALLPGLVNAHTHVPMTLLRGLADDLRLDVWLMGYMMPVEREFVSPDFVRLGTKLACAEMIRSGVTTFADMYYFENEIAEATVEAGMRGLCSQTVMRFPTPDAHSFEESLTLAKEFIKKWKDHPLIVPSVAPHAPYTCTEEILKACKDLAMEYDVPLHIHLAETAFEVENMRASTGMPVIPYVKKQNLFEAKVLAAHCVHVDEGEIRTMQHATVGVAHNPSSNMKLASGIAPTYRMIELGLKVGIGTDGTASNNDLDMFEEMRLASFLSKVSTGDPTVIPARTALLMATRLGAEALHMGNLTGSIEIGKRADLILVDISPVHNVPHFRRDPNNVYAQIVYASKSSDVQDVMVNGVWLMRGKRLLTINEEDLIAHSQKYAQKIDVFLVQREKSVVSKLIAIGGATEEESFEIQAKVPIAALKSIQTAIDTSGLEIIRERHYREYDVYFSFEDADQGYLRYREDHFINAKDEVYQVRCRLTHIGLFSEKCPTEGAVLSRSRFLAPATQSLRFYREYFKPVREVEVEKDRLRYLVNYKDTEFFINLDTVTKPELGHFLEVKSKTWSSNDANKKSRLAAELINFLGASLEQVFSDDYIKIVSEPSK